MTKRVIKFPYTSAQIKRIHHENRCRDCGREGALVTKLQGHSVPLQCQWCGFRPGVKRVDMNWRQAQGLMKCLRKIEFTREEFTFEQIEFLYEVFVGLNEWLEGKSDDICDDLS